jgi:CheY-like chemotaxis protein
VPALLISDLSMPRVNGFQILHSLKKIRSVRLNCEQTQLVIVNGDSWCGRIGPQSA